MTEISRIHAAEKTGIFECSIRLVVIRTGTVLIFSRLYVRNP